MSKIAIVTVDDEKIILDSIRVQLEKKYRDKYFLEFAESAHEAFEVIETLVEDQIYIVLVISDYSMPGMKGDEFAKLLKLKFPEVNIVMLTGQISAELSKELVKQNILLKVLTKPWKEDDLYAILNKLLSNEN
jgi:CheY-like chemotaxis protein